MSAFCILWALNHAHTTPALNYSGLLWEDYSMKGRKGEKLATDRKHGIHLLNLRVRNLGKKPALVSHCFILFEQALDVCIFID